MVLKAAILMASAGAAAVGVLVMRQQRLEAVHQMTRSMERAAETERLVWRLRGQIAHGTTPEAVRRLSASLGPMRPIPREVCSIAPAIDPPRNGRKPLASSASAASGGD